MKARFYGYCPISPGTSLVIKRWYGPTAGVDVLLEIVDENGVTWLGPEYPRDLAGHAQFNVNLAKRTVIVVETTIDATRGWTDFTVQEQV
jgi:hypothetical protein